jgi:hypothetical protein
VGLSVSSKLYKSVSETCFFSIMRVDVRNDCKLLMYITIYNQPTSRSTFLTGALSSSHHSDEGRGVCISKLGIFHTVTLLLMHLVARENFSAFMYNESLKSYVWNLGSSPTGTTSCMKVVPCTMVICFLKKLPHQFLLRPVSPPLSVMGEPIFYWCQLHGYVAVVRFSLRIMFCVCVFAINYSVSHFHIWLSNATVF